MAIARVFCGFFASLMIIFAAQNAFAAGYVCNITYTKCDNNYFLNGTGVGNSCKSCPANSTSTNATDTACTCNTGYSANGSKTTTSTACTLDKITCPAGQYLPAGKTECEDCPKGKYCKGGTYYYNATTDQGATVCTSGYYQANTGQSECLSCNKDNYIGWTTTGTTAADHDALIDCKKTYIFNKNGGVGSISKNNSEPENQSTISINCSGHICAIKALFYEFSKLSQPGYTFANSVNTQSNGKGKSYDYDNFISPEGETNILYAMKTANTYEIVLNSNCQGSHRDDANTCKNTTIYEWFDTGWYKDKDHTQAVPNVIPTQTGYTFDGFYDDQTQIVDSEGSCLVPYNYFTEDKTLYAKWTPNTFNISFDINIPKNATSTANHNMLLGLGQTMTCTYDELCYFGSTFNNVLSGWTFVGWALTPDADLVNNPELALEDFTNLTAEPDGTVTIYAIWNPNLYTMKLDSNPQGSNIGVAANTTDAKPNTIYELFDTGWFGDSAHKNEISKVNIPTQTGYAFDGFYYNNTITGKTIQLTDKDGKITASTNIFAGTATSYAEWTAKKYTIMFYPNNGIGGPGLMVVTYDSPVDNIDTENLPRRPGYTFAGYCDQVDSDGLCAGKMYFDKEGKYVGHESGQWRTPTLKSLYAVWSECTPGFYCPGDTYDDKRQCNKLERVAHPTFDIATDEDAEYWSHSDTGAINASDCYQICRSTGDSVTDDPSTNNGHGTLICATGTEVTVDGKKQCRAYYDPNRGNTDNGSCKYTTTKSTCHTGYSPSFAGHEIAACEPDGYKVTYHQNDGSTDTEWTYTQSCIVFSDCILEDLTAGAHKLPDRTGYVFTGWSVTRAYTATPWNGVNLKTQMPGDNKDGPTGNVPLYAVWGECAAGYYWDGNACTACPVDTYKTNITVANGDNDIQSCKPCGVKKYTVGTANTSDDACLTCEAGSYCDGKGIKLCPDYKVDSNFSKFAGLFAPKYTSDAGVDAATDCYIECPTLNVDYGRATPDAPRINYIDDNTKCTYTCVSETGNPGHVTNNRCWEDSCRPEFEKVNNVCTACFATEPEIRELVMSYQPDGNCKIASCVPGYHVAANDTTCEADERSCRIDDKTVNAYQVWIPSDGKFGDCAPRECTDGYHIEGNKCVFDTKDCYIENGVASMEWDYVHNRWGECIITKCNPGYTDDPYQSNNPTQKCGECRNKYGVNGEIAVGNYKQECDIDYCLYQGELYNLEGNECVPICDVKGYSDETGKMEYKPGKGCVITCEDGYTPWDEYKSTHPQWSTYKESTGISVY